MRKTETHHSFCFVCGAMQAEMLYAAEVQVDKFLADLVYPMLPYSSIILKSVPILE